MVLVNIGKEAFPDLWGSARVFCQGAHRPVQRSDVKGLCVRGLLGAWGGPSDAGSDAWGRESLCCSKRVGGNPTSLKGGECWEGKRNKRRKIPLPRSPLSSQKVERNQEVEGALVRSWRPGGHAAGPGLSPGSRRPPATPEAAPHLSEPLCQDC